MTFIELETGEQTDELSEGYNDYLEEFASRGDENEPYYGFGKICRCYDELEPLTFREWVNARGDESIAEKQMERAEEIRDERREDGINDQN